MRLIVVPLTAAVLVLTACGSEMSTESPAPSSPTSSAPVRTPGPTPAASPTAAADPAAEQSVIDDVQRYAPTLEQVYFGSGYPSDLAGAVKTAEQLTNLSLSPGNTIAAYTYDASDREFRLCIENTSGAFAVYDTAPMSTIESGPTGGCP